MPHLHTSTPYAHKDRRHYFQSGNAKYARFKCMLGVLSTLGLTRASEEIGEQWGLQCHPVCCRVTAGDTGLSRKDLQGKEFSHFWALTRLTRSVRSQPTTGPSLQGQSEGKASFFRTGRARWLEQVLRRASDKIKKNSTQQIVTMGYPLTHVSSDLTGFNSQVV